MDKTGRILMVKGQSKYDVLRRAADEVAAGFQKLGYEVVVADTLSDEPYMKKIADDSYDFCVIPQAFLFDVRLSSGEALPSVTSYPWIGWIFDDILYHSERVIENRYPGTMLLSVDGAAGDMVRSMGLGCNPVGTLLHGGFVCGKKVTKDIDIFCPCSVGRRPVMADPGDGSYEILKILADEAVDIWRDNPVLSAREALSIVCEAKGEALTGKVLIGLSGAVLYVSDMMRYLTRRAIVRALAGSGLAVHFAGTLDGDEDGSVADLNSSTCTVHGPAGIDETVSLIAGSRIVINPFPVVYREGAHERIFTAMLNSAVCFTPKHPFLEQLLGDRIEYIDIRKLLDGDTSEFIGGLERVLSDPAVAEKTESNRIYALENHTWAVRAAQIAELMEENGRNT